MYEEPRGRDWRKSSHSGTDGDCVEFAIDGERVLLRDSKDPTGPVLSFTRAEWIAFVRGTRDGEFDLG